MWSGGRWFLDFGWNLLERLEQTLDRGAHVEAAVVPFRAAHDGGAAFAGFGKSDHQGGRLIAPSPSLLPLGRIFTVGDAFTDFPVRLPSQGGVDEFCLQFRSTPGDPHGAVVGNGNFGRPKLLLEFGGEGQDAEHLTHPLFALPDQAGELTLGGNAFVLIKQGLEGFGHFDGSDVLALHVGNNTLPPTGEGVLGITGDDFDFRETDGLGGAVAAVAGENAEMIALRGDGDGFDDAVSPYGSNQAFHAPERASLVVGIFEQFVDGNDEPAPFGQNVQRIDSGFDQIEAAFAFR